MDRKDAQETIRLRILCVEALKGTYILLPSHSHNFHARENVTEATRAQIMLRINDMRAGVQDTTLRLKPSFLFLFFPSFFLPSLPFPHFSAPLTWQPTSLKKLRS